MEATGHYWRNLLAALAAAGHDVALVNLLRTHRFQGEGLARTKTDALDALSMARFGTRRGPPRPTSARPRPRSCASWCATATGCASSTAW